MGSNPVRVINGGLAQLGEHLPYKQGVTGSNPVSSIFKRSYGVGVITPACHAGDHEFETRTDRCYVINLIQQALHDGKWLGSSVGRAKD